MEGELQKTLGRNLRRLRESQGMSQEDFADKLGYHRTYLGGVERGERNLTLRSVERIASQTGADPISLLVEPKYGLADEATVRRAADRD